MSTRKGRYGDPRKRKDQDAAAPPATPTRDRLAEALKAASAPAEMVKAAAAGYYDDLESELATPIMQLVLDCQAAGLADVAERAKQGEFDATKAEHDAYFTHGEGRQILAQFADEVLSKHGVSGIPAASRGGASEREDPAVQERILDLLAADMANGGHPDRDHPVDTLTAVSALVELVPRSGGKNLEFGYRSAELLQGTAYAEAYYNPQRLVVDEQRNVREAALKLAVRILTGGACQKCHQKSGVTKDASCRWVITGAGLDGRWVSGCTAAADARGGKSDG